MKSNSYWGQVKTPLVYRLGNVTCATFYVFATSMLLMVVVFWSGVWLGQWPEAIGFLGLFPTALVSLVFLAVSIYCVIFPVRARLTITADA